MPTNYTIAEVEDKVIAALAAEMDYLKTCKSYQGELEQDLGKVLLLTPAALVVFNTRNSKRLTTGGHAHRRSMVFTVYVIARDLRGEDVARTKAESGIYAMIEDCDAALLDQKLGMDIPEPIHGGDAEMSVSRKEVSVFAVDYTVEIYKV